MSQHPNIDPTQTHFEARAAVPHNTAGGNDDWLDNLVHGQPSHEFSTPVSDPPVIDPVKDNATGRYVRRPDRRVGNYTIVDMSGTSTDPADLPPAAPTIHTTPKNSASEKWGNWVDWAMRPFTSAVVRLQVRGMERSARRAEMWQAYKESPNLKKFAMVAGDLALHGTVIVLLGRAIGQGLQGLEMLGVDVPLVNSPASSQQSPRSGSAPVPGPETSTKSSPNVTPSTGKSAAPTQSPSPSSSTPITEAKPSTPAGGSGTGPGAGGTETGGVTPNTTGESIQVPAELASRSPELGTYEWDEDHKVWKGTVWFQVDEYARELGIRDQFDAKEFRAIVDQALVNNKIGGEGAGYMERWEAAKHLSDGDIVKLDISLFEGKTDKPLVVANKASGSSLETPGNRLKEDNGVHTTLTVEDKNIVVQNDGDLVIDGKEIDTAVAPGSTLKSYLSYINSQFDPSMRISDLQMTLLEARLKATPEVANALGLDAQNPNAPMAFYGNVPPANAEIFEMAYRASLNQDTVINTDATTPSPSKTTAPSPKPPLSAPRDATQEYAWVGPALVGGSIALVAVAAAIVAVQIRNQSHSAPRKKKS